MGRVIPLGGQTGMSGPLMVNYMLTVLARYSDRSGDDGVLAQGWGSGFVCFLMVKS